MNQIVFMTTTWKTERKMQRGGGHGKNHRGFMTSEKSWAKAFLLTGKEILLQSIFLLTPVCNRHKHVPVLVVLIICPVFKSAGNDAAQCKWWELGERAMRPVPRASGILELWKMYACRLFIFLQRAQFPGSVGVKHTSFGTDLSPLIGLA